MLAAIPDLDLLLARTREGAGLLDSRAHGEQHWLAVVRTGIELAPLVPGTDVTVLFLFGLLHDCRRLNDHIDPEHGPRAADVARGLNRDGVIVLAEPQLDQLTRACFDHD